MQRNGDITDEFPQVPFPTAYFRHHPSTASGLSFTAAKRRAYASFACRAFGVILIPLLALGALRLAVRKSPRAHSIVDALGLVGAFGYGFSSRLGVQRALPKLVDQLAGIQLREGMIASPRDLERRARRSHQAALEALTFASRAHRPVVLYLRGFGLEARTGELRGRLLQTLTGRGIAFEREAMEVACDRLSFVGLANPADVLLFDGRDAFPRIFADYDHWEGILERLIPCASRIVVNLGDCGPGVELELAHILRQERMADTLLVLPPGGLRLVEESDAPIPPHAEQIDEVDTVAASSPPASTGRRSKGEEFAALVADVLDEDESPDAPVRVKPPFADMVAGFPNVTPYEFATDSLNDFLGLMPFSSGSAPELAAARALRKLPKDPDLALLLAAGAGDRYPGSPIVSRVLRETLTEFRRRAVIKTPGTVHDVAFAPDGSRLVTAGSWDARVWTVPDGDLSLVLEGSLSTVLSAHYSPDSSQIVTGGSDGAANVWNASTGELLWVLPAGDTPVRSACFSPNGNRILTACYDGLIREWDALRRTELAVLPNVGTVHSAAYSPDGSRVVVACSDGSVQVIDVNSPGSQAPKVLKAHTGAVNAVACSPTGVDIASASDDGTVRVWGIHGDKPRTTFEFGGAAKCVAFSPDGSQVAAGGSGRVLVWHYRPSEAKLWEFRTDTAALVNSVAFAPNSKLLATGSYDDKVRLWNVGRDWEVCVLRRHLGPAHAGAFSPNGDIVATASEDRSVCVWDATDGSRIRCMTGHSGPVRTVVFAQEGTHLLTASLDGTARIWDATEGGEESMVYRHPAPVLQATYRASGQELVTCSADGVARLWEVKTGALLSVLRNEKQDIRMLECSPTGGHLAILRNEGAGEVRRADSGETLLILDQSTVHVAFDPQDRLLGAVTQDGVRIWDLTTLQPLLAMKDVDGKAGCLAFSPDLTRMASCVHRLVTVRDLSEGAELGHFASGAEVLHLTWSQDSTRILACDADGIATVWEDLPMGALCELARVRATRDLTPSEHEWYFGS